MLNKLWLSLLKSVIEAIFPFSSEIRFDKNTHCLCFMKQKALSIIKNLDTLKLLPNFHKNIINLLIATETTNWSPRKTRPTKTSRPARLRRHVLLLDAGPVGQIRQVRVQALGTALPLHPVPKVFAIFVVAKVQLAQAVVVVVFVQTLVHQVLLPQARVVLFRVRISGHREVEAKWKRC